ncbi:MAG: translation initiation factor IF-2 N-terminal domain-containing protein [Cyanobacteria bacterium SZAS TMP-1]|nr:translation initiation factor IF-2 N-terminal domain-containing protein [Cyanobacteria bacterium SZAS TMP-1]
MTESVRVYELARRYQFASEDVIACLRGLGYEVKSHSSRIDAVAVKEFSVYIKKKGKKAIEGLGRSPEENRRKIRPRRDNDSDDTFGSRVPKKPYPADGDTSVRLPLPKKKKTEE